MRWRVRRGARPDLLRMHRNPRRLMPRDPEADGRAALAPTGAEPAHPDPQGQWIGVSACDQAECASRDGFVRHGAAPAGAGPEQNRSARADAARSTRNGRAKYVCRSENSNTLSTNTM